MVMTKYIQRIGRICTRVDVLLDKSYTERVNLQKWHQYIQQCTVHTFS